MHSTNDKRVHQFLFFSLRVKTILQLQNNTTVTKPISEPNAFLTCYYRIHSTILLLSSMANNQATQNETMAEIPTATEVQGPFL